jgi:guanylate kinase
MSTQNTENTENKKMTGIFFLLVGPSGVGKGTILSEIKKDFEGDDRFLFPVTATTREPREGEVDGKDYFFLEKTDFEKGIEQGDFLEHAIVHGENYYGLPKKQVFDALEKGVHVIRELDIQGLWNLQEVLPEENLFSFFLLPPSMEELEQRIRGRSALPEEEVIRRMNSAKVEIENAKDCHICVTSHTGKVGEAKAKIKNLMMKEIFKAAEE